MNALFRRLLCFGLVCLCLCAGVCAAGPDDALPDENQEDTEPVEVVVPPVEVVLPDNLVVSSSTNDDLVNALVSALSTLGSRSIEDGELDSVRAVSVPLEEVDTGIEPLYDKDDTQTTEPSGTLKAILTKLIGPYNPIVVEYRYQNSNQSSYSYVRQIVPDYAWCGSAALFCLLIFCTFRLGGALLRKT